MLMAFLLLHLLQFKYQPRYNCPFETFAGTGCFRRFAVLPKRNEFLLSSSYPSQT